MIAGSLPGADATPSGCSSAAAVLAGASAIGQRALSRDVLPDLSDPQVVVLADWMGHPAMEVADQVTQLLTDALARPAGLDSDPRPVDGRDGLPGRDLRFDVGGRARPRRRSPPASSKVAAAPARRRCACRSVPEASSTGWIYQYALLPPDTKTGNDDGSAPARQGPASLFGLRRFQDDVLRPRLAAISGVAEVASLGGDKEELLIETTPDQLAAAGVAYSDLVGGDARGHRRSRGRRSSRSGEASRRASSTVDGRRSAGRSGSGRRGTPASAASPR